MHDDLTKFSNRFLEMHFASLSVGTYPCPGPLQRFKVVDRTVSAHMLLDQVVVTQKENSCDWVISTQSSNLFLFR